MSGTKEMGCLHGTQEYFLTCKGQHALLLSVTLTQFRRTTQILQKADGEGAGAGPTQKRKSILISKGILMV